MASPGSTDSLPSLGGGSRPRTRSRFPSSAILGEEILDSRSLRRTNKATSSSTLPSIEDVDEAVSGSDPKRNLPSHADAHTAAPAADAPTGPGQSGQKDLTPVASSVVGDIVVHPNLSALAPRPSSSVPRTLRPSSSLPPRAAQQIQAIPFSPARTILRSPPSVALPQTPSRPFPPQDVPSIPTVDSRLHSINHFSGIPPTPAAPLPSTFPSGTHAPGTHIPPSGCASVPIPSGTSNLVPPSSTFPAASGPLVPVPHSSTLPQDSITLSQADLTELLRTFGSQVTQAPGPFVTNASLHGFTPGTSINLPGLVGFTPSAPTNPVGFTFIAPTNPVGFTPSAPTNPVGFTSIAPTNPVGFTPIALTNLVTSSSNPASSQSGSIAPSSDSALNLSGSVTRP